MSTAQDTIDLTTSPVSPALPASLTSCYPRRHCTASPTYEGPSNVPGCQRQKRRWLEVVSDVEHVETDVGQPQSEPRHPPPSDAGQSSSVLAQLSTWEIPLDVVSDDAPLPTGGEPPALVDQPVTTSTGVSAPIKLSDSDGPIVVSSIADRTSPGPPTVAPATLSRTLTPNPTVDAPSTHQAPEPLSTYTCPICFGPPTNATLTPCGHICCGQCLFTAVKSTLRRNMAVAMDVPRCPVCRAEIPGWDGRGGGVVGLKMQVLYSL